MSLKKMLGLSGFSISDEEIMAKMSQAHRSGREYIEFIDTGRTVRLHIHECTSRRDFDPSDRCWLG